MMIRALELALASLAKASGSKSLHQPIAIGKGVDQNRNAELGGRRDQAVCGWVFEIEALQARMQLETQEAELLDAFLQLCACVVLGGMNVDEAMQALVICKSLGQFLRSPGLRLQMKNKAVRHVTGGERLWASTAAATLGSRDTSGDKWRWASMVDVTDTARSRYGGTTQRNPPTPTRSADRPPS